MNATLLTTLVCLALVGRMQAQQLPLLSQVRESAGVLNPAALPSSYLRFGHSVQAVATHRDQWVQLEGHPRTSQLSASLFFDEYEGVAPLAGAYLVHDQTGPTGFTGIYGRFAGVLTQDPYEGGISLGIEAGLTQHRLDIADLRFRDEETVVGDGNARQLTPDVGVGIFAYKRLRDALVYGGISAPQALGLELQFEGDDGAFTTRRVRHYYAHAGVQLPAGRDGFVEPEAWLRFVPGAPVNARATARYQSPAAFFLALGGSSSGAAHGEVGVTLGDRDTQLFRVGYGYEYAFRRYGSFVGATHEINLAYSFTR